MRFLTPRARRWLFLVAPPLVVVGIWQCLATGEGINADGISYLDLARQYSSGDVSAVANGYWSPVYPALIGVALRLFGFLGARELAVVYAVNVTLLVGALAAFALLLDALVGHEVGAARRFGDPWSLAATWSVAAWTLIKLGGVAVVTPDMLVAALFFAATALLVRRMRGQLEWRGHVAFGAIVGAAYWAKAVMFPIALVLLLVFSHFVRSLPNKGERRRMLMAVQVAFCAVAIPLLIIQSAAANRPSFGETGRLNYAWFVNGAEATVTSITDTARPPRAILGLTTVPGAKLYADSAPGTFPAWYDPSRWNPGVGPRLDMDAQLGALRVNGRWLRLVIGAPVLIVLLLVGLSVEARRRLWTGAWPALLAPIATIGLYALVHVEGRLVGASVAVLLVVALAIADAHVGQMRPQLREALYAALIAFCLFDTGRQLVRGPRVGASRHSSQVAAAVREAGLKPGDAIAIIGSALDQGSYWAHLARLQIIATIPTAAESMLTTAAMTAFTAEACSAGRDLRAVIGRGEAWQRATTTRPLDDGWFLWLNPTSCSPKR